MKMKTTGMMDIKQGFFYAIHFSPFCWLHILLVCFFSIRFLNHFYDLCFFLIPSNKILNDIITYGYELFSDVRIHARRLWSDCLLRRKKIDVKSYTFYEFKAQMRSLLEQNFALFGFLC